MQVDSRIPGYLTTPGGQLLFDADGKCWRTAAWRPEYAIPQCDPEIVRQRRLREILEEEAVPDEQEEQVIAALEGDDEGEDQVEAIEENGTPAIVIPEEIPTERPLVFDADAGFHFGHSRLSYQGRRAVESLADRLALFQARNLKVHIVGHTDRIGSHAANMTLSLERARAVRAALIEEGIAEDAITIEGRGPDKPVTVAEECPNDLVRCELIMCLAPDRRVEINVQGTRTVTRRNR